MSTFNHNNFNYTCECGETFINSQKFNNHKGFCKIHYLAKYGSDEKYNLRIFKNRENHKKAVAKHAENCAIKKESELKKWISEKHVCEKCGKIMTEKYATGRFCSAKCSHSRKQTEETKEKTKKAMTDFYEKNGKRRTDIFCINCGKKIAYNNKTKLCLKCLNEEKRKFKIDEYYLNRSKKANNYLWKNYPAFDCNENGKVFKNGVEIVPFTSKKYLQVCLYDKNGRKKITGVHVVIAMKYLNYYEDCVVHHKDGNTHNNNLSNLEVLSVSEHARLHIKLHPIKNKKSWNKGKKMSEETKKKISEAAKKRHAKEREKKEMS